MIRAVRSRADRDDRDAGLGLVELLAASFISLLMLTLVGGMFLQVTRLTTAGETTKNATAVAWTVLNELSGTVRQATQVPIAQATTEGGVIAGSTSTRLVVDALDRASVTPGQAAIVPARVTFSVDATGALVAQRTPGVLTNGFYSFTGTSTTRTLNGPLDTTGVGTEALFVYYTGSGDTLTALTPGSAGLTTLQAAQVTTVGINVVVRGTADTDPVRLTNLITMPNLAILNGGY